MLSCAYYDDISLVCSNLRYLLIILFVMTLTLEEYFIKYSYIQVCLKFLHEETRIMDFWKEYHKGRMCLSSSGVQDINLIYDVNLDYWFKQCLADFSFVKLLFSPLNALLMGNKSILKEGKLSSTSWGECLQVSFGALEGSFLPNLCTYSIIYLSVRTVEIISFFRL